VSRFLMRLKGSVCTKSHPDGSIMEGFLFYDSLTLCARYLHGSTQFYRTVIVNEGLHIESSSTTLFNSTGRGLAGKSMVTLDHKTWLQAHRYVLFHYANIEPYLE
jgi:catechol-2,3-dioxygenase